MFFLCVIEDRSFLINLIKIRVEKEKSLIQLRVDEVKAEVENANKFKVIVKLQQKFNMDFFILIFFPF
jgi:hypothetical protein